MKWFAAICTLFLVAVARVSAQDPIRLVPHDVGFCLVVNDLRGHVKSLTTSDWWKAVVASPLAQHLLQSKEIRDFAAARDEVQRRLQFDWTAVRDQVFGERLVFAYRPPRPGQADSEEGMFLLQAPQAAALAKFVDKLQEELKRTGEIKAVTPLEHQGTAYFKVEQRNNTIYYAILDNLLLYAIREGTLKQLIERRRSEPEPSPIVSAFNKAGADKSLVSLWVNPRAFDGELTQRAAKAPSKEAAALRAFQVYWQAVDGIVINAEVGESVETRLTLQTAQGNLPRPLQRMFHEPVKNAATWNHIPSDAIFAFAGRLDLASVGDALSDFSTPDDRKTLVAQLQKTIGAVLGLDLQKELFPNVGPDWGFCILPGQGDKPLPQLLAVLGVQPGPKDVGVDQALFKGLQFLATLGVFEYNRTHSDPIRIKSAMQDKVEVRYLTNDQAFPPGFQPAWALKDGYLVVASSPEAVERFRKQETAAADGTILRVSAIELAKYLRSQREWMVEQIAQKNQLPVTVANQRFEMALSTLDLVDRVSLVHSSGQGQVQWTLRMSPRR